MRALGLAVALWLAIAAGPASAQIEQVDATLPMVNVPGFANRAVAPVGEGGPALVTISARSTPGEAVVVDLVFTYPVPPDQIALDELLAQIEVATETPAGEPFFASTIDPQLIPLNPNRAALRYRVTLYRPTDMATYRVRVRVMGNYE